MKNRTSFSIVLPTRDSADRILDFVSNILSINYDDFELIVVDSGSSDNTLCILKSINDYRLRVFDAKKSGVSLARNIGIRNARKDYLIFVDDDDEISDNILLVLNSKIQSLNFPDIIRFSGKREYADGRVGTIKNFNDKETRRLSKKQIKDALLSPRGKVNSYVWLLAIRNDGNIVCFDEKLDYLEDEKFYFENVLFSDRTVACIVESLYTYKNNANSKTKCIDGYMQNFIDMMKARNSIIKLLEDRDSILRYDSSLVHLFCLRAEYYFDILDNKRRKQMFDVIRRELRTNQIRVPIKYYKNKIEYMTLLDRTGLLFRIYKK